MLLAVLCDDEPQALERLRRLIVEDCEKNDRACQTLCCQGGEALLAADLSAAQVLFLDVEMPGKLAELEDRLADKGFLRIQKSYLVNMRAIQKLSSYQAVLADGSVLKASERSYAAVCRKYLLWRGAAI